MKTKLIILCLFVTLIVKFAFAVQSNWDEQLDKLIYQIDNEIKVGDEKVKIAVVDFSDLQGKVSNLGRFVSEELITRLFHFKRYTVVERLLLEKVMKENSLQLTGLIDPTSAVELGKILGVKAIVSGTLAELNNIIRINARIISTETGEVFSVASADINIDDSIKKLLGDVVSNNPPKDNKFASQKGLPGLKGEYYNLAPFSGSPTIPSGKPNFVRIDPTISFNWKENSPAPQISSDYFYIKWTGKIFIEISGTYVFRIGGWEGHYYGNTNIGIRLLVNNKSLIEKWSESDNGELGSGLFLEGNQWYSIQLEVFDRTDTAYCYLMWQPPGADNFAIIPSTVLKDE